MKFIREFYSVDMLELNIQKRNFAFTINPNCRGVDFFDRFFCMKFPRESGKNLKLRRIAGL